MAPLWHSTHLRIRLLGAQGSPSHRGALTLTLTLTLTLALTLTLTTSSTARRSSGWRGVAAMNEICMGVT